VLYIGDDIAGFPVREGVAVSEHVIRIIPDIDEVDPGYLFSFLASELVGKVLLAQGIYASVVTHITPDHIRSYPHVMHSSSGNVLSLRDPVLIEQDDYTFQQSEILNVSRSNGRLRITNEGKHRRFLPPMRRLRQEFAKSFKGKVDTYDAVTLNPIGPEADTCPSTRYLIVAQKPA